MYCDFFGFSEKPFSITPNPHFMYLSTIHREALARLLYGVDSRAGFITLTGEVGTGKTTMLRTLMEHLDKEKYRSALILNPHFSRVQLLANICREFEIKVSQKNSAGYLEALNRFLLDQNIQGKNVVLVIDEAQNLIPEVLEQVRLISNLETEHDKLIQIILAGQPEFNDILKRHDLRQLNQRIIVRCNLAAMDFFDTAEYIRHRLKLAGGRNPELFSMNVIKKIYKFSKGIPRLINVVCEQALVMSWTKESLMVSPQTAATVCS
jgi:general secretion pathway protein A